MRTVSEGERMTNKQKRMTDKQKLCVLAYADNNMSLKATAEKLFYHYNTIDHHLKAVYSKTGLNPKNFYDLCKLLETIDREASE